MDKKFLIIDSRPYGLFSIFLHTIDNIKWAQDNGYIPVVRWNPGRRDPNRGRVDRNNFLTENTPPSFNNTPGYKHCQCLYWNKDGWNGSKNPWEYYFQRLNSYTVEDATRQDFDISDIFMIGKSDNDIGNKFLIADIDRYEPLMLWNILGTDLEHKNRVEVSEVINNNVKIKPNIMKKIDNFHSKHFNKDVLAVHVRGTDKKLEYPHKALPLQAYLDAIREYLNTNPKSKIYVASDNNEAITTIIKEFGREKTIVYNAIRMNKYISKDPICLTPATGPKHGEECLIEATLLSKCKHLICTDSNVAAGALYMNPNLTVTYLNRMYGK
jgi:hypothetical protein